MYSHITLKVMRMHNPRISFQLYLIYISVLYDNSQNHKIDFCTLIFLIPSLFKYQF